MKINNPTEDAGQLHLLYKVRLEQTENGPLLQLHDSSSSSSRSCNSSDYPTTTITNHTSIYLTPSHHNTGGRDITVVQELIYRKLSTRE